jgi:hypothetical protein
LVAFGDDFWAGHKPPRYRDVRYAADMLRNALARLERASKLNPIAESQKFSLA